MDRRIGLLALTMLALTGCAHNPAPFAYQGHYYMAGDDNCRTVLAVSDTVVECQNKKGVITGHRSAMSNQDIQMYQYRQMQARADRAELNDSIRQAGQSFQTYAPPAPTYSTPTVQGIPAIGTTGYNQAGNALIGTDGTSCVTSGVSTICR